MIMTIQSNKNGDDEFPHPPVPFKPARPPPATNSLGEENQNESGAAIYTSDVYRVALPTK
jgi:hypothetical protein